MAIWREQSTLFGTEIHEGSSFPIWAVSSTYNEGWFDPLGSILNQLPVNKYSGYSMWQAPDLCSFFFFLNTAMTTALKSWLHRKDFWRYLPLGSFVGHFRWNLGWLYWRTIKFLEWHEPLWATTCLLPTFLSVHLISKCQWRTVRAIKGFGNSPNIFMELWNQNGLFSVSTSSSTEDDL